MTERTADIKRFLRVPEFISRGRERISEALNNTLDKISNSRFVNFFSGDNSTTVITPEMLVELAGSARVFRYPTPKDPGSRFSEIRQFLKPDLFEKLAPAVTPDQDVPDGSPIQSGQLELIAEVIAQAKLQQRSEIDGVSAGTFGRIRNFYRQPYKKIWDANLQCLNLDNKPIKTRALANLGTELGITRASITDPEKLTRFDRSLAIARQFEIEMANQASEAILQSVG